MAVSRNQRRRPVHSDLLCVQLGKGETPMPRSPDSLERRREQTRLWKKQNRARVLESDKRSRERNKGKQKAYFQRYQQAARDAVLLHYGGNPPRCSCCGEHNKEFLCVDHIGGRENKNDKGRRGAALYSWLAKNFYPLGYRVLCHNCNMALGLYGYCPHRPEEKGLPLRRGCYNGRQQHEHSENQRWLSIV